MCPQGKGGKDTGEWEESQKKKARPFLIIRTGNPKQCLVKTCRWPKQTDCLMSLQQSSDISDLINAAWEKDDDVAFWPPQSAQRKESPWLLIDPT